ncbi:MAG TPA: xanthine dehydrogenase family protein molybdopterin-binding subunit, partial [Geobacterales bacterium]|nr:xanthine dehydrogenase family protein molybdopterin-binding subunit [Geobacterales bacterium]
IADEMEAEWNSIRFEMAPARDAYRDPIWGAQATGGSSSIRHMYAPLRKAGAAARNMLITAAASEWQVPTSDCEAKLGKVIHRPSNRSLTFGELASAASRLPVPTEPPLKSEGEFRFIGRPIPRLDIREKVNGSAPFGMDTFVPNMLYAAIARPPALGATPFSFNREAPLLGNGVRRVIELPSGIAVCAETLQAAQKGCEALAPTWSKGSDPSLSTGEIERRFTEALRQPGLTARATGNAVKILGAARKKMIATYHLPYLAHATLEPMNCTARVDGDSCDIWVPTQNQSGVLALATKVTGLPAERIQVHTTYLGGGFGRRFEVDVVAEALALAKATSRPVKLIWSREEDTAHDFYRPATTSRIEATLNKQGRIAAWHHRIVAPSIFARVFPGMMKYGIDPAAIEGLENMEYEVPHLTVEWVRLDLPIPVGFWRSVGSSHNAFTVECFMDELAASARIDPVQFRLQHLRNNPRAKRVIELAAEKGGWGKKVVGKGALGFAYHRSFDSHVAQVAQISLDRRRSEITVHRVICAVDCGSVVNPATVEAQIRGAINFGLSATLHERILVANGGIASANFADYPLLRMDESPEIQVYLVASNEKHGGIGEPGVPPIAPAVANALFALTRVPVRSLPLDRNTMRIFLASNPLRGKRSVQLH